LSAHHNLFAHCVSRNPRFNGNRFGQEQELADFRNNVIYNWEHNSIYGGELGHYNIVNNYFKPGPNTKLSVTKRIVNPSKDDKNGTGIFFVSGNWVDGAELVSENNNLGVEFDPKLSSLEKESAITDKAFPVIDIPFQTAKEAYSSILNFVGVSYKRDTMDQRIIKDVILRKGSIIDVQGGFKHGTEFENTLLAWPTLKTGKLQEDQDKDGLPDSWEKQNGLNEKLYNTNGFDLSNEYTNIEVYLNSLVSKK
jgi:hypothetical protein